jgi:hypothetical protein
MRYNLIIALQVPPPGTHLTNIETAITSLGDVQCIFANSLWYVTSEKTAHQAGAEINQHLGSEDTLFVVNSTKNDYYLAPFHGAKDQQVRAFFNRNW